MRIRIQRSLVGVAALALVTSGAVVTSSVPAQAAVSGIQVREVTDAWNMSPGATVNRAVFCNTGEKVLQGGALSQTLEPGVIVLASFAFSETQWTFSVYNASSSIQEVHGRAICATGVDGYERKWGTGSIPNNSSADVTSLNCPAGKTSVGGGWQFSPARFGDWFVSSSYPSNNAWRVRFRNNGTLMQGAQAQAICTSQTGRVWTTTSVTVNAGSTKTATSNCGNDFWLVGGGFITQEDSSFNLVTAAIPTAGSPAFWKLNLKNRDSVSHTVKNVHVCLPK